MPKYLDDTTGTSDYINTLDNYNSKLDTLSQNKASKLERLAPSAANTMSAMDLQEYVGRTLHEDMVHTRDDGSKFTYDYTVDPTTGEYINPNREIDYTDINRYGTPDTRNVYIDDTAEGNYKLGLARSDKGFMGRYVSGEDGYGWAPGARGVTPEDGALMDVELKNDAATQLEYDVHSNRGQILNRAGGLTERDLLASNLGSGKSEYTTPDAPLWSGRDTTGELPTDTYMPKQVKDTSKVQSFDEWEKAQELNNGYVGNLVDAAQAGVGKFAARTGDAIVDGVVELGEQLTGKNEKEIGKYLADSVVGDYFSEGNFIGLDKYKLDKEYGYNPERVQKYMTEFKDTWSDDNASWTDKALVTFSAIEQFPEVIASSLGDIVAASTGPVGFASIAGGMMNETLEERLKNDGRDEATAEDYGIAGVSAIVYAAVNKFTGGNAGLKETSKLLSEAAKRMDKNSFKLLTGKLVESGLTEGLEEAIQGATEVVGTKLGTKKEDEILTEETALELGGQAALGAGGGVGTRATLDAPKITVGALDAAAKPLVAQRNKVLEARLEKERAEANAEVKSTLEASDIELGGEYTENTNLEDIGGKSVYETLDNLKSESKDLDEYQGKVEQQKQDVVGSLYQLDNSGNVKDVTAEARELAKNDPDAYAARVSKVQNWLADYSKEFENSTTVQKEMAALQSKEVLDLTKAPLLESEVEVDSVAQDITDSIVAQEGVKEYLDTQKPEVVRAAVQELVEGKVVDVVDGKKTYKKGYDEASVTKLVDTVSGNLTASGFAMQPGVTVEWDRKAIEKQAQEDAGLGDSDTRLKAKGKGEPAVNSQMVTDSVLKSILKDGIDVAKATSAGLGDLTMKAKNLVVKKLDPLSTSGVKRNITKTLNELDSKINSVVDTESTVFNPETRQENNRRLLVTALGTINAATVSDTEQRQKTVVQGRDDVMQKDQYYASMAGVEVQIGKDYASSYGIQFTGDAVSVLKQYREIGKHAIKMAEEAGLVTIEDNMYSRIGDNTFTSENRKFTPGGAKAFESLEGTDVLTEESVVVFKDKGIRLADANDMVNTSVGNAKREVYRSETGDVVKRINKLLIPNRVLAPTTEPAVGDIKIDPDMTLNDEIEGTVKKLRRQAFQINPKIYEMLSGVREVVNKYDGNIYEAIKKNSWIGDMIGLESTGAAMLAASEQGSNFAKIENLESILDNLDTLDGNIYFEHQVDINNRITVMQSVLNYQSDKVISRYAVESAEGKVQIKDKDIVGKVVQNIIEELGVAKTGKEYKALAKDMMSGNRDNYMVDLLKTMHEEVQSGSELSSKVETVMGLAEGNNLGFEGQYFKLVRLLEAVNDVTEMKDGVLRTNYDMEMDAKSSGVTNTLLNIAGRFSDTEFKELLGALGLKKAGKTLGTELVDAYSMLSKKVDGVLEVKEGLNKFKIKNKRSEVAGLVNTLKDLDIDTRELAKPPVMTWFYSAGETSITKELTGFIIAEVVGKAANGDQAALKHLGEVLGRKIYVTDVLQIQPLSTDHKAMMEAYNKVGDIYNSQLDEAFPEVSKYKEDMSSIFDKTVNEGNVDGYDFFKGWMKSASSALYGDKGVTNIYKLKNVQLGLDTAEQREAGLTDAESGELFTTSRKMANVSSTNPLTMQSIDSSGQLLPAFEELYKTAPEDGDLSGIKSVHDAYYGRADQLVKLQETYDDKTIEVAVKYDAVDNLLDSMQHTIDNMDSMLGMTDAEIVAEAKKQGVTVKDVATFKKNIEKQKQNLETYYDGKKAENDGYIAVKRRRLEDATINMLGVPKVDVELEVVETKSEQPKKRVVKKVEQKEPMVKAEEEAMFEEQLSPVDEFLISEKTTEDVEKLLGKLVATNNRAGELTVDLDKVVFETVDEGKLKKQLTKESYNEVMSSTGAFAVGNTVYLRDLEGSKEYTEDSLLDVIAHEVEHAVTNKYLESDAGKKSVEYKYLEKVLGKLSEKTIEARTKGGQRLAYVMGYAKNGNTEQAIKELVSIYQGEPEVRASLMANIDRELGTKSRVKGAIQRILDTIKDIIAGKSYSEIVAELGKDAEVNIDNIGLAVEAVSAASRDSQVMKQLEEAGKRKASSFNLDVDFGKCKN